MRNYIPKNPRIFLAAGTRVAFTRQTKVGKLVLANSS